MRKKELLARIEALEREVEDLKARLEWQEARPWPVSVPVYPTWPTYPTYPYPVTTVTYGPNTCDTAIIDPERATPFGIYATGPQVDCSVLY